MRNSSDERLPAFLGSPTLQVLLPPLSLLGANQHARSGGSWILGASLVVMGAYLPLRAPIQRKPGLWLAALFGLDILMSLWRPSLKGVLLGIFLVTCGVQVGTLLKGLPRGPVQALVPVLIIALTTLWGGPWAIPVQLFGAWVALVLYKGDTLPTSQQHWDLLLHIALVGAAFAACARAFPILPMALP